MALDLGISKYEFDKAKDDEQLAAWARKHGVPIMLRIQDLIWEQNEMQHLVYSLHDYLREWNKRVDEIRAKPVHEGDI